MPTKKSVKKNQNGRRYYPTLRKLKLRLEIQGVRSTDCAAGMLRALQMLPHCLSDSFQLWGTRLLLSHCTDEEPEAQRWSACSQGHSVKQQQNWDRNPGVPHSSWWIDFWAPCLCSFLKNPKCSHVTPENLYTYFLTSCCRFLKMCQPYKRADTQLSFNETPQ